MLFLDRSCLPFQRDPVGGSVMFFSPFSQIAVNAHSFEWIPCTL